MLCYFMNHFLKKKKNHLQNANKAKMFFSQDILHFGSHLYGGRVQQ